MLRHQSTFFFFSFFFFFCCPYSLIQQQWIVVGVWESETGGTFATSWTCVLFYSGPGSRPVSCSRFAWWKKVRGENRNLCGLWLRRSSVLNPATGETPPSKPLWFIRFSKLRVFLVFFIEMNPFITDHSSWRLRDKKICVEGVYWSFWLMTAKIDRQNNWPVGWKFW